jgi:hypothetical protein
LIIDINDYQDSAIPDLKTVVKEAVDIIRVYSIIGLMKAIDDTDAK